MNRITLHRPARGEIATSFNFWLSTSSHKTTCWDFLGGAVVKNPPAMDIYTLPNVK